MFDRTAFFLVADHGMEEATPGSPATGPPALDATGIPYRDEAYGFLYLDPARRCRGEGTHRVRSRDTNPVGRQRALRTVRRHARAAGVRLPLVVRAPDRGGARPAHRPGGGRRPYRAAQARHQRAGGSGAQPSRAGQGAGQPGSIVGRPVAAGRRTRRAGARRAPGVRRRPRANGPACSTRRWSSSGGCGPRTTCTTTASTSTSKV